LLEIPKSTALHHPETKLTQRTEYYGNKAFSQTECLPSIDINLIYVVELNSLIC